MMVMIKKRLLLIVLAQLLLVGCATNIPKNLGISDLEWSSYSKEKQQSLLAHYEKVVKEHKNTKQPEPKAGNKVLIVGITNGQVMFPPSFINWQNYKPVRFAVYAGQCRNVKLEHKSDAKTKTELRACYYGNVLYLDPSRYNFIKRHGTASIHSSPLWLEGFAYKGVNSHGYVRLSNVTVTIKLQL